MNWAHSIRDSDSHCFTQDMKKYMMHVGTIGRRAIAWRRLKVMLCVPVS